MKHIIIGTAGHIDHGKTTLIEAMTGRSTDRLDEEKERGISIELGFTYFDLPSGRRAGIVDVPGHERFVKNMLAGVMGMDIVMLVIAADEGVMPQTKEHLAILNMLGIEKGFIVLTKSDLVEEEWLELVQEDIQEHMQGTFLENSPILPVSSTKGTGIAGVVELIDRLAPEVDDRETDDMPRLPVDRVFSITGFGTIVTGTLLSGTFSQGDEVEIFPKGSLGRIRSLQVHDESTEIAYAGQRVAINIAGLKKDDIDRGDVVAPPHSMKKTLMLDVRLRLIEDLDRAIENRTRLRVYIGSAEVLGRIVILDKEVLNPGEEAFAQLRLEEEVVAKRGDKFIVRFYSPMFTIGGGDILEPNPTKKRRFDSKAIEELRIKAEGRPIDIIERTVLDSSKDFPNIREISKSTAMLEENVRKEIENLAAQDKLISFRLTKDIYVIHMNYFEELRESILGELDRFHDRYPLRMGMAKEEIRSKFLGRANPGVGDRFLDILIEQGAIEQQMENIVLKGFQIEYNELQDDIRDAILRIYMDSAYMPPRMEELLQMLEYGEQDIHKVFNALINSGDIIKLNEELYLHIDHYHRALEALKEYISDNKSIAIGEYRDLLDTNRKMALGLLEHFDNLKITVRDGNGRKLVRDG